MEPGLISMVNKVFDWVSVSCSGTAIWEAFMFQDFLGTVLVPYWNVCLSVTSDYLSIKMYFITYPPTQESFPLPF